MFETAGVKNPRRSFTLYCRSLVDLLDMGGRQEIGRVKVRYRTGAKCEEEGSDIFSSTNDLIGR